MDKATLTNSNGNYIFDDVSDGDVTVGVVIPYGYISNATSLDLVTTTYVSGDSVEVDFDINQLDSISGYVYEDTNADGVFDDDETGIQGVTLYIDENNNGSYDPGTDTEAVTNSDGFWRFYNVEVNTTYTINILAYPSQLTTSEDASLVVDTTTETIPDDTYTEFSGNNVGVYSSAASDVSDKSYMTYILNYHPADGSISTTQTDDPDNDDLTNKIEQLLNTDPGSANVSPTPVIGIGSSSVEGNVVLVEFDQVSTNRYIVQGSSDLVTWETLDSFRANDTSPIILEIDTDLMATEGLFIRIEISD